MNWKPVIALFLIINSFLAHSQVPDIWDTAYVNKMVLESKNHLTSDTTKAINLSQKAIDISKKIKYPQGEAYALKNLGLVYYMQGKQVETLNYWNQSLKIFEEIKDDVGTANILNNIAAVYFDQGVDEKALEYSLRSLRFAEKTQDKLRILSALTTIGAIYHNKKNPVAINYLLKALPLCEETGNKDSYVIIAGNLGEIYFDNKQYDKALEYYNKAINTQHSSGNVAFAYNGLGKVYLQKGDPTAALKNHEIALALSQKLDDKMQLVRSYGGEADVHASTNNIAKALNFYERAIKLAESINANVELKDLYPAIAKIHSKLDNYQQAYQFQTKYANVKDTLYNIETAKKLGKLQFDFDMAKKEGEINLLTKEKSLREAEVKSARQARTALTVGLVLILIIAFIIYRNYLNKAKTNKILDKQKAEIESLVLNILPEEIATELKTQGQATPRQISDVSVLFTDFKGFTTIADKLSPSDLVYELNECFMEFDNIIDRYDLEKIKTMGDAYMCAGNIPSPDPNHAYKIVRAGLDILEYMRTSNLKRQQLGADLWEVRIGIHIGPVVAGVVGKKKYAYDIWGSTVNIASRMESNGDPERVNISSTTYHLVKQYFECSYRGKVNAKNLGEIDMYFVEYEKKEHIKEGATKKADVQV